MSQSTPPSYLRAAEYAKIEAAMMQSEKGRSFLRDYLARNRSTETRSLLEAMEKLRRSVSEMSIARRMDHVRGELAELKADLEEGRRALAAMVPAQASSARPSLPRAAFAETALEARAANDVIREAVAAIRSALSMPGRATGDDRLAGQIERQLDLIEGGCKAHDLNRERTAKLGELLGGAEAEIMAILELWEDDPFNLDKRAAVAADAVEDESLADALRKGLYEELSFALLTDTQKAALFN